MKVVKCPICDGEGRCFSGFLVSNCHGCGGTENQRGRGWVEVHEEAKCKVTILEGNGYISPDATTIPDVGPEREITIW